MAVLHEPAAIALETRERLEFTSVGEGGVPYIKPKVIGVAIGKLAPTDPPTAIIPLLSIEITEIDPLPLGW